MVVFGFQQVEPYPSREPSARFFHDLLPPQVEEMVISPVMTAVAVEPS